MREGSSAGRSRGRGGPSRGARRAALAAVRLAGLAAGLAVPAWRLAGAQSPLTAAEERSVVLPKQASQATLDLNDTEFGLHVFRDVNKGASTVLNLCQLDTAKYGKRVLSASIPNHSELRTDFSLSATEGKRSVVKSGRLVPGVELGLTRAWFFEHGIVSPARTLCDSVARRLLADTTARFRVPLVSRGYDAVFATVTGKVLERNTATASGAAGATAIALEDGAGGVLSLLLGWNHAFREHRVLGLGVDAGREWASPGESDPQSTCTISASAPGSDPGTTVNVEDCEDRYVGPLPDVWRAQLRLAYTQQLWLFEGGAGPSIGAVAAATATGRTESAPTYAAAAGLTLHPKDKPSHVVGAALLELADLSNTTGKHPTLLKMLNVRLVVGLPLN